MSALATQVSLQDLLSHGERYHQQTISAVGTASALTILHGPANRLFYTFVLQDDVSRPGTVTVIMQGKPEIAVGDVVWVYGVFIQSRKAGRTTITNRIEATIVKQLHDRREPLVG